MAVSGDSRGFYRLLGVTRAASADEIRAAFRERAKIYHPDAGGAPDDERFHHLREAYEVLRDPQRRLRYDAEELDAERRRDGARRAAAVDGAGLRGAGLAGLARLGGLRAHAVPAAFAVLALALAGAAALAVGRGREAGRLRAELDGLRLQGPATVPASPAAAAASVPAGDAAGQDVLYTASFAFPAGSAEFEEGLAARLDEGLSELRDAIRALPAEGGWSVLVDGRSARAASESGVAVEAWELALLRVATLTEFLVQSAVPAERVAVRFLAGGGEPSAAEDEEGRTVEVRLLCCRGP